MKCILRKDTFMKHSKPILTVLLAVLLTLGAFGCAKTDEAEANATAAPNGSTDPNLSETVAGFDRDAIAVELGSVKITAGDIADSYSYYMNMLETYYGTTPTDDASIKEYRDLAVDDLISYHVPEWKAAEYGITLTAEDEARIAEDAAQQIEDLRDELICEYAYYYAGADEVNSSDELTEEERDIALNQIASELAMYFYDGYTLDQYSADQYEVLLKDLRVEAYRDALKAYTANADISDEEIESWYAAELENQQAAYDEDPFDYREHVEDLENGYTSVPVLYVPEGFMKVQVIRIAPKAERDLLIDTNRAEMADLEAEYGALVLNNEDAARQAEIVTRYAELKAENDALEEAFLGETRDAINKAYEALEEETLFEDVMAAYNEDGKTIELLLYLDDEDADDPELAMAAKGILLNTYSEPLLIGDVYYILKRVEAPKAGTVDRAAIAEEIRAAATAERNNTAWDALYAEWETEAETAAVRHEETYAAVGYLNQY